MESCYADTQDYSACTVTKLGNTGLNLSAGATPASGQVAIAAAGTNTYTLTAKSKSLNTFTITKTSSGTLTHSCAVPSNNNEGGCQNVSGGAGTW
jgi:hypothetical protein